MSSSSSKEQHHDDAKDWTAFLPPPGNQLCHSVFNRNHHEFIFASKSKSKSHPEHKLVDTILTYNTHQNKWTQITMQYPKTHWDICWDTCFQISQFIFHKHSNKLIKFDDVGGIVIMNLKTHTVDLIKNIEIVDQVRPPMVSVGDAIHLIGARKHDDLHFCKAKHFIWNENGCAFTQLTCFPEFTAINDSAAIYIPQSEKIIHIGGMGGKYTQYSNCHHTRLLNHIYVYSLKSNTWISLPDFRFEGSLMQLALTSDQRHIIIAGGLDGGSYSPPTDAIYVLEIRNKDEYVLRKSNIVCPMAGKCHIAITGGIKDEMLVIGYLKRLFNSSEFQTMQLPPFYIMKMIVTCFSVEMLHWFG
eukprot:595342_1